MLQDTLHTRSSPVLKYSTFPIVLFMALKYVVCLVRRGPSGFDGSKQFGLDNLISVSSSLAFLANRRAGIRNGLFRNTGELNCVGSRSLAAQLPLTSRTL